MSWRHASLTIIVAVLAATAVLQSKSLVQNRRLAAEIAPILVGGRVPLEHRLRLATGDTPLVTCRVLVFSSPTCAACKTLARALAEEASYGGLTHVLWVSLADDSLAEAFARDHAIPQHADARIVGYQALAPYIHRLRLTGTPTIIATDSAGAVVSRTLGADKDALMAPVPGCR